MDGVLPDDCQTVAERLSQSGYYTVGYSHNPLVGAVPNGLQRGFQKFLNYKMQAAGLLAFQFDQKKKTTSLITKIKHRGRFLLAESLGYSQQTNLQYLSVIGQPLWESLLSFRKQSKSELARQSLAVASQTLINRPGLKEEQPIFAFINLMGTHVPYAPPKEKLRRFLPTHLGIDHAKQWLQKANKWQVDVRNWFDIVIEHEEYQAIINAIYDAEVAEQDAQLGMFFEKLKEANSFEETLIIVTADHGDHLGEKHRLNHAFGVYEPLTHVPLLIHDPSGKLAKSTTIKQSVSTRRLFHTILGEAYTATDEELHLSLANWADLISDEVVLSEGYPLDWALHRLDKYQSNVVASCQTLTQAMYDDQYKIIVQGEQNELYNLALDQLELNNLSEQMKKQTYELRGRLNMFVSQFAPMAVQDGNRDIEDEELLAQLRNLGYLE
jgi:arylsulfatase A-like enzyme